MYDLISGLIAGAFAIFILVLLIDGIAIFVKYAIGYLFKKGE